MPPPQNDKLLKMCHLRQGLRIYFVEKLFSVLKIFNFCFFEPCQDLPNLWLHDEYKYMGQDAFLNISLETQLIKSPNLANWYIKARKIIFRNFLNNLFQVLFNLATCSNYSIINYVKIPVFHFFEKVNEGQLKMVNVNY